MAGTSRQYEDPIKPDRLLTTHQVGRIIQMDPTSVAGWCNAGRLQSFRTPGGHRRIRAGDLARFLRSSRMPLPSALRLC